MFVTQFIKLQTFKQIAFNYKFRAFQIVLFQKFTNSMNEKLVDWLDVNQSKSKNKKINRFVFKLTEIEFRCKIERNTLAKVECSAKNNKKD